KKKRTGFAFGRLRIQHRLGQGQNGQGGNQKTEQKQPQRGMRRRFLLLPQRQQQSQRREGDLLGCRRRDAQQPPQDRQGQKRRQGEWRGESEAAQREHGASTSCVQPYPVSL